MSATAFPLQWPEGWPRTPSHKQESDNIFRGRVYGLTFGRARDGLMDELGRLGARNVVLSSNLALRGDGVPYAQQRRVTDPGLAVYFTLKGRQLAMAADRYQSIEGNARSLALAIEAMRQLERHGGRSMMERAFTGFASLPPPRSCWDILGLTPGASAAAVEAQFRKRAMEAHPDQGGSNAAMADLNRARSEALKGAAS